VALQIGQYHQNGGDTLDTIKLIVTNANYYTDSDVPFLAYFSTNFNAGVSPGAFLWAPPTEQDGTAQPVPWRSPQIFSDELNENTLKSRFQTIPNRNFTYATISTRTVSNTAYGVKAGQNVDIMYMKVSGKKKGKVRLTTSA